MLCVREDPLLTTFGPAPLLHHVVGRASLLQDAANRSIAVDALDVLVEVAARPHSHDQVFGGYLCKVNHSHTSFRGGFPHVNLDVVLLLVLWDVICLGWLSHHALRQQCCTMLCRLLPAADTTSLLDIGLALEGSPLLGLEDEPPDTHAGARTLPAGRFLTHFCFTRFLAAMVALSGRAGAQQRVVAYQNH